jgi:hypothetical protein
VTLTNWVEIAVFVIVIVWRFIFSRSGADTKHALSALVHEGQHGEAVKEMCDGQCMTRTVWSKGKELLFPPFPPQSPCRILATVVPPLMSSTRTTLRFR